MHIKQLPDGSAYLNVGAGSHFHPDWTNIDLVSTAPEVIAHNILKGLPYAASTFDAVYHSHVLEHLNRADGKRMIAECFRVLKPGGVIRVVVPDLAYVCHRYVQLYTEAQAAPDDPVKAERHEWALINVIDQMVRTTPGGELGRFVTRPNLLDKEFIRSQGTLLDEMTRAKPAPSVSLVTRLKRATPGKVWRILKNRALLALLGESYRLALYRQRGEIHLWMYDALSLRHLLEDIGFTAVQMMTAETSRIPDWETYQLDMNADGVIRKPHSLFAEALKPST
ncbi:MAG: methyltransferase domain-containing protein [bacterium]|nr:methyltransferase domain-containing protein [bacterium]